MKKILCAFMLLLCFGSTLWIEQATAKTVSFTIRNNNDWDAFHAEVAKARGQYWVDARLEADITTTWGIGLDADTPYRGTFDGNGHTVNVNINRDDGKPCALFCYVSDVTIKDLRLTGKIGGGRHSAGLIGIAQAGTPTITINRVWVSTEVSTTDTHAGGIIGHSNKAKVYMNDCRFDGRVNTDRSDNSFAGEIIGWCNGGSWTLHRVYDQGSPNAHWMYFCFDYNQSSGNWYSWGSNSKSSLTITHHGWDKVNHNNKKDQNEVVRLMNANSDNSWTLYDGKAVPIMDENVNFSKYTEITEGSSNGYALSEGRYYIKNDLTFSNNNIGGSGISINSGATVYIYIPKGVTLTAIGHDASGQDGAGAGILLPQGSTLFLEGGGTVRAIGGNAANGENGGKGDDASYNDDSMLPGGGGAGGAGGGGAGAGIGTKGGDGGKGGSGAAPLRGFSGVKVMSGNPGNSGEDGTSALSMGALFVELLNTSTVIQLPLTPWVAVPDHLAMAVLMAKALI